MYGTYARVKQAALLVVQHIYVGLMMDAKISQISPAWKYHDHSIESIMVEMLMARV